MWLRYGFLFMDWTMITVNSVGLVCQSIYIIFFLVYSSRQVGGHFCWESSFVENLVSSCSSSIYTDLSTISYPLQASLTKQLVFVLIFTSSLLWIIDHYDEPVFINGILAYVNIVCCYSKSTVIMISSINQLIFPLCISCLLIHSTTFSLIACASPLAAIQDVIKTRTVAALPFPIIVSSFIVSSLWLAYGYLVEDSFLQFSNAVATCISGSQLLLFAIYPSTRPYAKLKTKRTVSIMRITNS